MFKNLLHKQWEELFLVSLKIAIDFLCDLLYTMDPFTINTHKLKS